MDVDHCAKKKKQYCTKEADESASISNDSLFYTK